VSPKLQEELTQSKPFASQAVEAYLSLQLTAEMLSWALTERLKQADLTPAQYNVLRILRGAGESGASCSVISDRLIKKDADITRLLDRLESRELVSRERVAQDRRVIITRITGTGLALLAELDAPVAECHRQQLAPLGEKKLATLIKLLEEVRDIQR
jgi:DNA-binding MarR family transcriptional regulator